MIKNMTKGSPTRLLATFALPILVGGLVRHGYVMADAIIVGQAIGVEGFAAIGAVDNIDGLIVGFGMMMVQGFAILIAQRFGADDGAGLRKSVAMSFLMTVVAGLCLTGIAFLTLTPLMRALQIPQEIMVNARRYISILLGCMLAPMLTRMAYATLQALGDSRTPLYCMIASSLCNIVLDAVLILGLGMGVGAAAVATIIAQVLMWPYLIWRMRRIPALRFTRADLIRPWPVARKLLGLSVPLALQNSVALIGVILLQAVVNGFGVMAVAAFTAAMRIYYFMKEPSEAMHHALASYVGQNVGAQAMDRVRAGVRAATRITLSICAVAMAIMLLLGRHIVGWIVSPQETETVAMAVLLLRVLAVMLPVVYLMFLFRGALQGMGSTMTLLASGAVEMVLRTVFALTLPALLGFVGVGIAETSAWLGAMLMYVVRYAQLMRRPKIEAQ